MSKSTVVTLRQPESVHDPLTEMLRAGARQLLAEAIEAEVASFLAEYEHERDQAGRQRLVRNGYLPGREIQTGIGGVAVKVPRVRDRQPAEGQALQFRSKLVPPYLRRAKSVEELLPWLYLRGISTGDFSDALSALLGPGAPGLSAPTISRLKKSWTKEYETWRVRDLAGKRYAYVWADGIYAKARLEDAKLCLLVLIGATKDGKKELIAGSGSMVKPRLSSPRSISSHEAALSRYPSSTAVGDGALGFWKALAQVWGNTQPQRCWVHYAYLRIMPTLGQKFLVEAVVPAMASA